MAATPSVRASKWWTSLPLAAFTGRAVLDEAATDPSVGTAEGFVWMRPDGRRGLPLVAWMARLLGVLLLLVVASYLIQCLNGLPPNSDALGYELCPAPGDSFGRIEWRWTPPGLYCAADIDDPILSPDRQETVFVGRSVYPRYQWVALGSAILASLLIAMPAMASGAHTKRRGPRAAESQ
jgi:hypothetical protein